MGTRAKPVVDATEPDNGDKAAKTYELLKKVRESKTVQLKASRFMRATFEGIDGTEQPFSLRYYQVQGAYHLLALKRMVLGDDAGTGKTIQAISAFAHMLERNPRTKVVIVTPKSTVRQWAREIRRFSTGIRPIVVETASSKDGVSPLDQRRARYREWLQAPTGPDDERVVLILNYALLIRDWNAEGYQPVDAKGKPDPKKPVVPGVLDQVILDASKGDQLVTFFDEAQAFANARTKTWEISKFLSERSERAYGLTATLLKNNLIEGFGIYKVIKPTLFRNKTRFISEFCLTQMQKVPGSQRKIPIVVGYKNLDAFRQRIDPFFLGRKKQDVSTELPVLISKDVACELTLAEDAKYAQALTGVLELGDGTVKDYEEHKTLVALNYCQQIVNSLSMIRYDEGSEVATGDLDLDTLDYKSIKVGTLGTKEHALVDLVSDGGELEGEKVIVFTRFASLVPRLQKILEAKRIQSVAITGKQNERKRNAAQEAFQDSKSGVRVVFITTAGGVGINLQMARAMVFYELPWTWGDYIQILGRMIRIGSPHKGVVTYHLMAERPSTRSGKTIDHHVYALLRKKKELIDQVLGEAAVGALEFAKGESNVRELLRALQLEARAKSLAA